MFTIEWRAYTCKVRRPMVYSVWYTYTRTFGCRLSACYCPTRLVSQCEKDVHTVRAVLIRHSGTCPSFLRVRQRVHGKSSSTFFSFFCPFSRGSWNFQRRERRNIRTRSGTQLRRLQYLSIKLSKSFFDICKKKKGNVIIYLRGDRRGRCNSGGEILS